MILRHRLVCARSLFVISLLAPTIASAQSADSRAAAQTLFDEGRRLMTQGHFAEACKKLEGSEKLDPGAGTLLNLASCYEQNGQTASAWITYKDAATAAGDRHPDWASQANDGANALEPKLSRLTIVIGASTPGMQVLRDGSVVEPTTLGVALPIDPGSHTVEATAPGHARFKVTVDVGASKARASVTVPALAVDDSPQKQATAGTPQRIVGGAMMGVGGVGLIVGVVFGVLALGKKSDASDPRTCNADFTTCSPAGKVLVEDAKSAGLVSTVSLIAGGVMVVGGLVVVLIAPHTEKGPSLQARMGAPGAPWGMTFGGAF